MKQSAYQFEFFIAILNRSYWEGVGNNFFGGLDNRVSGE